MKPEGKTMKQFDLFTEIQRSWDETSYGDKLSIVRVGQTLLGNLEKELSMKCPGSRAAAIGASVTRDESEWQPYECPECGENVKLEGHPPRIAVHDRKGASEG